MANRRNEYHRTKQNHSRRLIISALLIAILGGGILGSYLFHAYHEKDIKQNIVSKKQQSQTSDSPIEAAPNTSKIAQDPKNDTPAQHKLRAIINKQKLNGIVISTTVNSNQPVVVTDGFSNVLTGTVINEHTLFPISSFQKMFTGIILDHLIAEGKLSLNTRLNKFYPEIRFSDRISIQNLLSHTSGIKSGDIFPVAPLTSEKSQLEFNQHIMKSTGIFKWSYSSANYALLAGIIVKLTGKSYQANVEQYIIQPLGLKETYFYNTLPNNPDLAYPENLNTLLAQKVYLADIRRIVSADYGSGDIFQSASDFYKVLVATENGTLIPKNRLANFFPGGSRAYTNGMYIQYGLIHAAAANLNYYGSYYGNTKTLKNTILLTTNGSLQTIRVASVDLYHAINH
ncbi:serine hydrolase domain-containing protein [Periweissella fabalis]|uniref:Beta-lactamase family protein n=1 Tax=Periweissella fabalis TaxID=1070421 RepID=A0A7X6N0U1_9LACO|nr:serine hydrolase domain-containing protein [Periweissella fabalis]MCM0599434.1 beta-lactamase family protein [Periweissella fabalis]NKZ23713.1 beta-lactamase family protein [Periweissella fabalis]